MDDLNASLDELRAALRELARRSACVDLGSLGWSAAEELLTQQLLQAGDDLLREATRLAENLDGADDTLAVVEENLHRGA